MTQVYSVGFTIDALAAYTRGDNTGPLCGIIPTDVTRPRLRQLTIGFVSPIPQAAEVITLGIGNPATTGVASQYVMPVGENMVIPNFLQIATNWSTFPTAPTVYYRRFNFNAASAGFSSNFYDFWFPAGLTITPGQSLAVWGISLPSFTSQSQAYFDINIKLDL